MKLTIGMSCYDDFDGVWFTINSIRMFHPEVIDDIRFVVVDGNPDNPHGRECEKLISKLTNKHGNCGLYVKNVSWASTASRDYVFQYAQTPYVLCVDSHVMLPPGCLKKLIDYYESNPGCNDLLQGPIIDENGKIFATEMLPRWDYNMYGKWAINDQNVLRDQPYEVTMMGLGLFSCRKDAWLGFNPAFRGFGGEEGYIHRKYRKAGHRTLILPWLKWIHRFARPNGVPYHNEYIDRIKNYLIGWTELGDDTSEIMDYFSKENTGDGQQRPAIPVQQLRAFESQCQDMVNSQHGIMVNSQPPELMSPEQLKQHIKHLETML